MTTSTSVQFIEGRDIIDCRSEFGNDHGPDHADCERIIRDMSPGAPNEFGYDPTGCRDVPECSTCGETSCDRWNEPAPVLVTYTHQSMSPGNNSAACDICGALVADWATKYVNGKTQAGPTVNRDKHTAWHAKIGF